MFQALSASFNACFKSPEFGIPNIQVDAANVSKFPSTRATSSFCSVNGGFHIPVFDMPPVIKLANGLNARNSRTIIDITTILR